jgi:hydrogenase expression/formation protein HypD
MKENNLTVFIRRFQENYQDSRFTLMEVCGTHTNVIRKAGIHQLLPRGIRLLSGPGCPVCVTGSGYIEQAITLSREPQVIITTFGDLLKVPGNTGTLTEARADGSRIQVVYTPLDAVEIAKANPEAEVVFLGVGFETTAPVIALAVQTAREQRVKNFSVLPAFKILRPALEKLLTDPEIRIDGLIAPGHLGVIVGAKAFSFLVSEYHLPTVVTGFKPNELWLGLAALARQIISGKVELENTYPQAVTEEGNLSAKQLMREVYILEDTEWRGLGFIPQSGLGFNQDYRQYDARIRFAMEPVLSVEPSGCICGSILLGKEEPENCSHFGKSCKPDHPIGPCMVSSEGTCAAHFYYPKSVK